VHHVFFTPAGAAHLQEEERATEKDAEL